MKDILNNFKTSDTWKIQLTIAINFISSHNINEEHVLHSKSDSIEIKIYDKADESLFQRYQIGRETSMKGSDFIFDSANLICCITNSKK